MKVESKSIWVFPKIGVPQNGWFILEDPIKTDDFGGTTILGNPHIDSCDSIFSTSSGPGLRGGN